MSNLPLHLRISKIICAACGAVVEKTETEKWNDEKAYDEYRKAFPNGKESDIVAVCDDCFKILLEMEKQIPGNDGILAKLNKSKDEASS